jgi:superfamily II DNA/RNA helicase
MPYQLSADAEAQIAAGRMLSAMLVDFYCSTSADDALTMRCWDWPGDLSYPANDVIAGSSQVSYASMHRRLTIERDVRFSAGLSAEPLRITLALDAGAAPAISHSAIAVDAGLRTRLLRHLLAQYGWDRVLVFVATKFAAEIVADKLRKGGVAAEPLHGQLSQGKRSQVLTDFQAARVAVVVATDLAARGIDIAQMPVVVHYDLPRSADDYTHRSGRTARAGDAGLALSFVCADTEAHWQLICKRQDLDATLEVMDGFEPVHSATPRVHDPDGTGGIKGKRPSKKDKLRAAAAAAPS